MTAILTFAAILFALQGNATTESRDFPEPAPKASLAQQRAVNEAVYRKNAASLKSLHAGRWVVIADGVVTASFECFESAVATADRAFPKADHRFVFRPGIDDGDEEFVQSPWSNADPSWIQLGRRFRSDYPLTLTVSDWRRDARIHTTHEGRGAIALGAPGSRPAATARAVCSNLFEQDLTITGSIAESLKLERFSVPGTAFLGSHDRIACTKVLCRVTLDDLGIDDVFTAFVIPRAHVERWTPRMR